MTRVELETSLDLASSYLAAQQAPDGHFVYAYDWWTRRTLHRDNPVRQAGAAWAAVLAYQHAPSHQSLRTAGAALAYVESRELAGQPLGAVALGALAEIDYAASAGTIVAACHRPQLDRMVGALLAARRADGLFGSHGADTEPSPYYDGETLLALAKLVRAQSRSNLRRLVVESALAMRQRHVVDALQDDPDSDDTKGFYQWGSMAFYELSRTDWPETQSLSDTVVTLGDWVLDKHAVLDRHDNTGYAVEGLVMAYMVARQASDLRHEAKFRAAIEHILGKLAAWQVGGPRASSLLRSHCAEPRAIGGIQNAPTDPVIRIDVVQHQMHATMMALDAFYPSGGTV